MREVCVNPEPATAKGHTDNLGTSGLGLARLFVAMFLGVSIQIGSRSVG